MVKKKQLPNQEIRSIVSVRVQCVVSLRLWVQFIVSIHPAPDLNKTIYSLL